MCADQVSCTMEISSFGDIIIAPLTASYPSHTYQYSNVVTNVKR